VFGGSRCQKVCGFGGHRVHEVCVGGPVFGRPAVFEGSRCSEFAAFDACGVAGSRRWEARDLDLWWSLWAVREICAHHKFKIGAMLRGRGEGSRREVLEVIEG